MNKNDVLAVFDGFSEKLLKVLSENEAVKQQVQDLVEENARLRLEVSRLKDLLVATQGTDQPVTSPSNAGKETMDAIYQEGYHICNVFYGQSRDNTEDCAFCVTSLEGD